MAMKSLAALLIWLSSVLVALAQTQSVLPQGMEQFVDGNGAPYAGGKVYMYVPGTSTPKTTFKDSLGLVPNTNPIVLDANGRAIIWGSGLYRQVLDDSNGNLIWDQNTFAAATTTQVGSSACATTSTTGSANSQILTPTPAVASLVVGTIYCGVAGYSNTGPMTLAVGSTTPHTVEKQSSTGLQALQGGEVIVGQGYLWQWDGIEFQLLNNSYGNSYPVIDLAALGAVGDGSTNNNNAFNAAFAQAAVAGGMMRVPCGTYVITSTPTATVPGGANIGLVGSGADCTVLLFEGAIDGPTFTMTNQWSSVMVRDITVATTSVGGQSGIRLVSTNINSAEAFSSQTTFQNIVLRGNDNYSGGNTEYWGAGISEQNVSNVSIVNELFNGPQGAPAGNAIALSGYGAASMYSVQIDVVNLSANYCADAINYGDWVQGVQMTNSNVTGCVNGIVVGSSPSGGLSELAVTNSQFNASSCAICVNDATFANLQLSNNQLIVSPTAIGVKVGGTNWSVTGNQFNAFGSPSSNFGLIVGSTLGNGGVVSANAFSNFEVAINVQAASTAPVQLANNQFANNVVDYGVNSGSSGVIITDIRPRTYSGTSLSPGLVTCNSATRYAQFLIADAPSATFNTTVTSGGGANFLGVKCDGSRWYVD
jgi:hypothetical protein